MNNVARFEVNGNTYEIIRTRYLQAEFNRISEENKELSPEDEKGYALLQDKYARLEKLSNRVKELEDKYYESFDDADGELYDKAKAQYDKVYQETIDFELSLNGIAKRVQKIAIDNAEKVLIRALQIDKEGKEIRTHKEAEDIWCSYVDEVGKNAAVEWLLYFVNYVTGNDSVEDDPFVAQAKAKAEQKANMRQGLKRIK